MCGRYSLTASPETVEAEFGLAVSPEPFPPRYNIAPTQPIPVVHLDDADRRRLTLMRWGLVPSWVKDPKEFSLLINARIETAADKPAFRAAMKRRRCLVPASGFYEWQKREAGPKRPFLLSAPDAPLFAFAGLWETWVGPDGEEIDTAAILTREASPDIAGIHTRMPVVVPPEAYAVWLDARTYDPAEALGALEPTGAGFFTAREITRRINDARNEGAAVQAPPETDDAATDGIPDPAAADRRGARRTRGEPAATRGTAAGKPEKAKGDAKAARERGQLDLLE